jgi:enoyl-[acyl-carrier protein] reductase II
MALILKKKVPIVFTSAGNPALWTQHLKAAGVVVVHVVSSVKFALKAQAAGVDAVVAEGFEAGGHNGREETTTMTLIPLVRKAIDIPLLAAGGIGSGAAMAAALALGADGVQVGSRFVASQEASSHPNFKQKVVEAQEGSTVLTHKELNPVRLLKNPFCKEIEALYAQGADAETLKAHLGIGRAKKGMFEGDLEQGELEIGQVAATIDTILPVQQIIADFIAEYHQSIARLSK